LSLISENRYRKTVAQLQFQAAERLKNMTRTAGRGETQPARYGVGTKVPDHTPPVRGLPPLNNANNLSDIGIYPA